MSRAQTLFITTLAIIMIFTAYALGNWAEQINPDGITPHPTSEGEDAVIAAPRDAFSFGASMGLLASGLAYCCLAFGLLIRARSTGRGATAFTYSVAGLAVLGFILSYIVDDYFY